MVSRRSRARALAAILVLTGAIVALLLPTYTCPPPYKLVRLQLADPSSEEAVCSRSDIGYAPRSWNPTKIAVAAGGVALGIAILLGARRKLTSLAAVLVYAALTIGWFLPNGYVQPTRSGVSVCRQREIDQSAWRAA